MRVTFELSLDDYLFILGKTDDYKEGVFPVNSKNLAWIEIGKKYGFDPWTIEPINYYRFTAEEKNYDD